MQLTSSRPYRSSVADVAELLEGLATVSPLSLARALPLALLAPLASRFLPQAVSLSLALAIACSASFASTQPSSLAGSAWIAALARELCLGLTFALACAVPLLAAGSLGRLVDRFHAPQQRARGPYAALYELSAWYSFFALGGHRAWFASYARTFTAAPIGEPGFVRTRFAEGVLAIGMDAIALSLTLALPLLVSLWLSELALGLIQRAAAGVTLSFFELVRTIAVLGLVLVTAPRVVDALPDAIRTTLSGARVLIVDVFG